MIEGHVHLTGDDVRVVLDAIREGRVRDLTGVPYDRLVWANEVKEQEAKELVRDWLERTHMPRRARQIVSQLRRKMTVKSRQLAPTVDVALRAMTARNERLEARITQLEKVVVELKQAIAELAR